MQLGTKVLATGCTLLGLTIGLVGFSIYNRVRGEIEAVVSPAKTDTVYMPSTIVEAVITDAKNPPKLSIGERISTKEVQPDTVYIAKTDTTYAPEQLPDYGIQRIDKEDKELRVTALARDGSEVQVHVLTLPNESSNYSLTSGEKAVTLRVDRRLDLVSLEAEVSGVIGTGGPTLLVSGPVSLNVTSNLNVSPAVMLDSDGMSVGVSVKLKF